jgi:hypothetical protein
MRAKGTRLTVLKSVAAMMAAGVFAGYLGFVLAGLGGRREVMALYALDWSLGGASVGGAVVVTAARLLGGQVGEWGTYVTGAAMGFVSWEVVALVLGWGMWASGSGTDQFNLVFSVLLMSLGCLLFPRVVRRVSKTR